MAIQIEALELSVESVVKNQANLDSLIDSLSRMKETVKGGLGLNAAVKQLNNLAAAIEKVANTPGLNSTIDMVQQLGKAWSGWGSKEPGTENLEKAWNKVETALKDVNTEIQNIGKSSKQTAQTTNGLQKRMDGLQKTSTKTAKSTSVLAKGFGKLFKSIGRIAFYRAIREAIKNVTGAFKEGVETLYHWSEAGGDMGKFASSMDMIATAVKYLKNALGALVSPIIDLVAPAIDWLIDKFVALLNIVNEGLARLTGASGWRKAIKYPVQFADKTTKAAKAVKDFTMGWDELNVINDNNGGSGSEAEDYSKYFEWVDFADETKETTKAIESFIKAFDVQGIVDAWENLKTKWNEFRDAVDKFMNSPLGQWLASFLATITSKAIITGINLLADSLGILSGVLQLLSGDLGGISTIVENVARSVAELLGLIASIWVAITPEGEKKEKAETAWAEMMQTMYDEAAKLGGLFDGEGEGFGAELDDLFGFSTFWEDLKRDFNNAFIGPASDMLLDLFGADTWAEVGRAFEFGWADIAVWFKENVSKPIQEAWKSVREFFKKYPSVSEFVKPKWEALKLWIYNKIITPILNKFTWFKERVSTIWTQAKNAAIAPWVAIKKWFNENVVEPVKKLFNSDGDDSLKAKIKKPFVDAFNAIKNWWNNTWNFTSLKNSIVSAFNNIVQYLPNWVKGLLGIKPVELSMKITGGGGAGGGVALVSAYANGGVPNTGSLFWAGEAGPELVDRVGGQTTVYNAGQLAQELSVANGNVVGAIYGMRDAVCGAIAAKDTTVRISGGDIGRANAEYQRKRGVYVNTGAFANAY